MMKLPVFVLCVWATVLAATPVLAQPETAAEKPRITQAAAGDPAKQVDDFFRVLTEGRVDAAYDILLRGTKIAEMPKDVATLKAKTREAIRVYGDINGYDLVDTKGVGQHLTRITCLSLAKNLPIRWRFYFYSVDAAVTRSLAGTTGPAAISTGTWKLIDIRIDDRLPDLFEEPAPMMVAAPAK